MVGLIARVTAFYRRVTARSARISYAKAAPGNEPALQAEHYGAPGDDAHPLAGDYAYLAPGPRTGRWAALGYLDSKSTPVAGPGDRRIYSRSEPGTKAAEVWCKADGTILARNDAVAVELAPDGSASLDNGSGSIELQSGGNVVINGVTIDTSGNISTGGSIEGDGITDSNGDVTLGTHTHGTPPSTPPPTAGS